MGEADPKTIKLVRSFELLLGRELEQLKHERAYAGAPGSEAATWQAAEAEYILSLWREALVEAGFDGKGASGL